MTDAAAILFPESRGVPSVISDSGGCQTVFWNVNAGGPCVTAGRVTGILFMSIFTDTLNAMFAGRALILDDDTECRRILTEQGLIDKLHCQPPHNKATATTVATVRGQRCYVHASHDYGHARPQDNGYTILALPVEHWSQAEAVKFIAELMGETSFGPSIAIEMPLAGLS
jgi:hypothetical protein